MDFLGLSLFSWSTPEPSPTKAGEEGFSEKNQEFVDFRSHFDEEVDSYQQAETTLDYIPSSGQGEDEGVHHRLPDGRPVTYDDIRRAVAEGRGQEDVSPYFAGQTNEQALAALGFSEAMESAPEVISTVMALSTRSWLSLASSLTDTFGLGESIRTALKESTTEERLAARPKL